MKKVIAIHTSNAEKANPEAKFKLRPENYKTIAAVALFAIAASGGIGYGFTRASEAPVDTESSNNPANMQEIQDFITKHGDEYGSKDETLATYYAEKAFETESSSTAILTDEYIKNYEKTYDTSQDSPLGFTTYHMNPDAEINEKLSIKIFNKYTSVMLSRYMNLWAKNATPEARDVIDSEFIKYCSDSDPSFTKDDKDVKYLMEVVQKIVNKYGSDSNYSVDSATTTTSGKFVHNTAFVEKLQPIIETFDQDGEYLSKWKNYGVVIRVNIAKYDETGHPFYYIDGTKNILLSNTQQPYGYDGLQGVSIGVENPEKVKATKG